MSNINSKNETLKQVFEGMLDTIKNDADFQEMLIGDDYTIDELKNILIDQWFFNDDSCALDKDICLRDFISHNYSTAIKNQLRKRRTYARAKHKRELGIKQPDNYHVGIVPFHCVCGGLIPSPESFTYRSAVRKMNELNAKIQPGEDRYGVYRAEEDGSYDLVRV